MGCWAGGLGWVVGLVGWAGLLGWWVGFGCWAGGSGWIVGLARGLGCWAGGLGAVGLVGYVRMHTYVRTYVDASIYRGG